MCRRHPDQEGAAGDGVVPTGPLAKEEDGSRYRSKGVGSRGVCDMKRRLGVCLDSCHTRKIETDCVHQVVGTTANWLEALFQRVYVEEFLHRRDAIRCPPRSQH